MGTNTYLISKSQYPRGRESRAQEFRRLPSYRSLSHSLRVLRRNLEVFETITRYRMIATSIKICYIYLTYIFCRLSNFIS